MAFLTLTDIGKIYVSEGNVTVGIRGINLSFDKGEFIAVTGKSGSGKSTLLNVISGMDSYEEGEMYVEGQSTSHYLQPDWEEYRSKYISFIFQDYNIIDSFTVLQNVELALMHIEDKNERRKRALELIDRVGMTSHLKHKGSKLSGGQKQRTVIARALAKDSPIILADEPTGNLDSVTSEEIIKLLHEVSKDKILIVVTHNYEEVEAYATRHIRFFDGSVESDTVIKKPYTPLESEIQKPKQTSKKSTQIKNGITLGKAIFTSRPKLSFFLCLLMILGTLGMFLVSSSFGDMSEVFGESYMFNNIEGRVVITKLSGEVISDEELEKMTRDLGADSFLHYDLLLDQEEDYSFRCYDPTEDRYVSKAYNATYGEDFGNDIIGDYPKSDNEVFLYLPISESLLFGKDSILVDELTYNGLTLKITGIKYYYDNNITGKCLFTEQGFKIATATYFLNSQTSYAIKVNISSNDDSVNDTAYFYSFSPSFDVEEGKLCINSAEFMKAYENNFDITVNFDFQYSKYNYYSSYVSQEDDVFNYKVEKDFISKERVSGTSNEEKILIHPSLLAEISEGLLKESYRQASLFFENDSKAEESVEKLKEMGYIAVPADTTYTPDQFTAIISVLSGVITLFTWGLSIVFLAFFVNLCSHRTLGAFKGDMAIMRSMGISVKSIRIGMYVRMLISLIPAFIAVICAAILIFTSAKFNQMFTFLYPYQYCLIFVGMLLITFRVTRKQIKTLFEESVKKSLRGGAVE